MNSIPMEELGLGGNSDALVILQVLRGGVRSNNNHGPNGFDACSSCYESWNVWRRCSSPPVLPMLLHNYFAHMIKLRAKGVLGQGTRCDWLSLPSSISALYKLGYNKSLNTQNITEHALNLSFKLIHIDTHITG
jgi:hypothetical protein